MNNTRLVVLGISATIVLSACASLGSNPQGTPTPSPTGSVHIQLLGAGGPYSAGPPNIAAARSEPELDALLQAVAPSFHQPDPWDASAGVQDRVYLGLATRFCTVLHSVTADLTGPALVIVRPAISGQCAPGAGTAARPPMYLAAISIGELPQEIVTFRLADGTGQARVDLRPERKAVSPQEVAGLAQNGVRAAFLHVGPDGSSRAIAEVDVLQFPTSPSLCNTTAPAAGQPAGAYVVVNEGPTFPSHEEGFVWLDGALTDCGSAS